MTLIQAYFAYNLFASGYVLGWRYPETRNTVSDLTRLVIAIFITLLFGCAISVILIVSGVGITIWEWLCSTFKIGYIIKYVVLKRSPEVGIQNALDMVCKLKENADKQTPYKWYEFKNRINYWCINWSIDRFERKLNMMDNAWDYSEKDLSK